MIEHGLSRAAPHLAALPLERRALGERVLRDFYGTFYVTQGEPMAQTPLLELVHQYYRETLPPEQYRGLPRLTEQLDPLIGTLLLPAFHHRPDVMNSRTKHAAVSYREWLAKSFYEPWRMLASSVAHDPPMTDGYKLYVSEEVVLTLEERELKFVTKGRPRVEAGGDPYMSILREHVLLGGPPHTETLQAVAGGVAEACFTRRTRGVIDLIAHAWEASHPGQQFYEGIRQR